MIPIRGVTTPTSSPRRYSIIVLTNITTLNRCKMAVEILSPYYLAGHINCKVSTDNNMICFVAVELCWIYKINNDTDLE